MPTADQRLKPTPMERRLIEPKYHPLVLFSPIYEPHNILLLYMKGFRLSALLTTLRYFHEPTSEGDFTSHYTEGQKPRQRVSVANRNFFARPENICPYGI